jgi:hypothetical protein
MTFSESTSGKSLDFEYKIGCGPWRWYRGVGEIHMNKGRVGEERGGKEMDGCPLTGQVGSSKQVKQTKHSEVSEMLELWVAKAMTENVPVNREILQQKWTSFANLVRVPDDKRLNLSKQWLTAFKKCFGLREFRHHEEAVYSDPVNVEKKWAQVYKLIAPHKYHLKDIFNMDEIGLLYA